MNKQVHPIVSGIIRELQQNLWHQLAVKSINKMVPFSVESMNVLTFESLTKLNTELIQPNGTINAIKNGQTFNKDNFLNGSVQVEKKQMLSPVASNEKQLEIKKKNTIVNASSTGVKTMTNFGLTKTSVKNPLLVELQFSKEREKQFKTSNIPNNEEINKKIENLRDRLIYIHENSRKEKEDLKMKEQLSLERRLDLQKKKAKIDRFTFDYNGQFFGSRISNPQSSLGLTKLKSASVNESVTTPVGNIQKVKPVFTQLVNQKLQQRFLKLKTESAELEQLTKSFNDNLSARRSKLVESQNINEGRSVNGEDSSARRYTQDRAKATLKQFKEGISDKRFTSFRIKPVFSECKNVSSSRKKINSYKSQQNFIDLKQNSQFKQAHLFGGRRKIKTTYQSEQTSILSNSKVSKPESKGKVLVNNQSLYSSVFEQPRA